MAARKKSDKNKSLLFSSGRIVRSQLVSNFGVGAIYELRRHSAATGSILHSVMVAGLDFWPERNMASLREPILEKLLGVKYFKLPPGEEEPDEVFIPVVRFPRWLVCSRCHRMGVVPTIFEDRGSAGPRCRAGDCDGRGIPSRLVSACYCRNSEKEELHPGHIDDFPWVWWAHSERGGTCSSPQLKLETEGRKASLSGLNVRCYSKDCKGKVGRTLERVFGAAALKSRRCSGNRPWLNDVEPDCKRPVRALQRGASNVYFGTSASTISIPPYSGKLIQILADHAQICVDGVGKFEINVLVNMAKNSVPSIQERSDRDIERGLMILAGREPITVQSLDDAKAGERAAMVEGRGDDDQTGEFLARPVDTNELSEPLRERLRSVVKVERLREVKSLRGFSRVVGATRFSGADQKLALLSRRATEWLPAIEVRGEGIYLEFDSSALRTWEESPAVIERMRLLAKNHLEGQRQKVTDASVKQTLKDIPSSRFVLVHTISHLLIKQLSLECGYSSAALRERIYVGRNEASGESWAGTLLYTATTGGDGTLGGLVRQGAPQILDRVIRAAAEGARWCSSDPLCLESTGQGVDAMNLAACHACCIISETSCDYRNMFLDRVLAIGVPDKMDSAFFGALPSD